MPSLAKLHQRGDTLVEVLICLAIIGAALTISYGTARRSLFKIEDAHERGEMLTIAQSELERLKDKLANDSTFYDKVSGLDSATGNITDLNDRIFCITAKGDGQGQGFDGIKLDDPGNTRCAVNQQGKFIMDEEPTHSPCPSTDTACQDLVNSKGFTYRVGVVYRPHYLIDGSGGRVDEWYIIAGRYAAGGGGNAKGFSVVPLMYRQHHE